MEWAMHNGNMNLFHGDLETTVTAVAKIGSELVDLGGEMSASASGLPAVQWCTLLVKFMEKSEDFAEGILSYTVS